MIPDRLYELALQYKKTKLWKKLWDSQLFAVRFSDGDIGYCCVMGRMGELNAIAIYPGQQGLDSLRVLHDEPDPLDELAYRERMHCQDCLMLSFLNKSELNPRDIEDIEAYCRAKGVDLRGRKAYPQFERLRPGYERWYLEDVTDQKHMIEGLEAALEVADRLTREMKTPELLGIFEGAPYDKDVQLLKKENVGYHWESFPLPPREAVVWPPVVIDDDLSCARLEKAPRKGEWAVKLFRHFQPLTRQADDGEISFDDLTEPPIYPWVIFIVEIKTNYIIGAHISDSADDYTRSLAEALVKDVSDYGMPEKIIVIDDRTEAALKVFCKSFDVKLQRRKHCKPLQNALDSMIEHFLYPPNEDEIREDIDAMLEMLRQPDVIQSMPDEMLIQFFQEVDPDEVPDDIRDNMIEEAVRRGMIEKR